LEGLSPLPPLRSERPVSRIFRLPDAHCPTPNLTAACLKRHVEQLVVAHPVVVPMPPRCCRLYFGLLPCGFLYSCPNPRSLLTRVFASAREPSLARCSGTRRRCSRFPRQIPCTAPLLLSSSLSPSLSSPLVAYLLSLSRRPQGNGDPNSPLVELEWAEMRGDIQTDASDKRW
jgi:hypothetical protein